MMSQSIYSQSQAQSQAHSQLSQPVKKQLHPTCTRCGSRKWRRDPNRGAVVCAEGHVLEGFLRESTEQIEVSQYTVRQRRLKAAPREKKRYVLKTTYEGQQARILLLQGLTLLLRKQIEGLIQIIRAPAQLEEITRNLWKSYLSVLELDDEVFARSRSASPTTPGARPTDDPEVAHGSSEAEESAPNSGRKDPASPASLLEKDANKTQLDPESLKEIAHHNSQESDDSLPSSGSFSSDSTTEGAREKSSRKKKRTQIENIKIHPRVEVTICTVFLACVKLRIPIILQDIINFIITKQLPYIGFGHSIPSEVKQKMNRSVMETLYVEKPPRLFYRRDDNNGLLSVCHQLINIFHAATPPPLSPENTISNLTLIVLRFSKVLLIPESLQLLSINLLQKLDSSCVDYHPPYGKTYANPATNQQRPSTNRYQGPKRKAIAKRQVARYPPEWFIMAVVYIVAQSAISNQANEFQAHLASEIYQPKTMSEMLGLISLQLPKPSEWYRNLVAEIERDNDQNPQKLWEKSVTDMDSREIDSYIELAKEFLLKDEPETNIISFKNQYFPLQEMSAGLGADQHGRRPRSAEGMRGRMDEGDDSADHHRDHPDIKEEERHVELLKTLLLNRAAEFVGCVDGNHCHLNEFIKVAFYVNSMLNKNLKL